MKSKRLICILLGLLLILTLAGCRSDKIARDKSSYQFQDNTAWKLRELGFANSRVDKVQATGEGKIFVLSEGMLYYLQEGKWNSSNPGGVVSTFYVLEDASQATVVAGMDDGKVYLCSMENGEWEQADIQTIPAAIDFITASPGTGEIYIGQSSKNGGGLWKGSDGGTVWEKLTSITVRGVAVHPENPEILYIVDKLTYLSANGGKEWNRVDTGANYGVFIHPLYTDTAYLAFAQGVVSVRHNGEIASQQRFFLPGGMTRLEFNPLSLNEWALGIWDFPSGTGGLYYTFNAGADWMEVGEDIEGSMILDLCYAKDGESLYIGTADKGLWLLNIAGLKAE